jgi:hypothetical protein
LRAVAIHQRLQRQRMLVASRRGDDSAFGIHGLFCGELPPATEVGKNAGQGQPGQCRDLNLKAIGPI